MMLEETMSDFAINVAFVQGFKNNIYMKAQQKDVRLFGRSRNEVQGSKLDFYEVLDSVDAVEVTTRHGDTPILNPEHSRRACVLTDAEYGAMIDKLDRVRLLINPEDAYVTQAVSALARKKDLVFIAAALGSARSGEDGNDLVALPDTQKMVAVDEDGTTGSSPLNTYTLTNVAEKFNSSEIDPDVSKNWAISPKQIRNLLNDEKITNADYAVVKTLTSGKIDMFMGFNFIMTNRLPVTAAETKYDADDGQVISTGAKTLAAGARRNFAWVEDGMISAVGKNNFGLKVSVDLVPMKRNSTLIQAVHSVGAVRLEDIKVIEILVAE
jgi:hypothetical protein